MSLERLDAFMARANDAYYATRDPFADFTTAPEISQVFGELLGAWAAVVWRSMGRPEPVLLVEAGPGRGTLMADALRLVARVAPDFAAALRLHLIEASPRLRGIQHAALAGITATQGVLAGAAPCWHAHLASLPDGPLILLANEFLDALPIRQFRREAAGWSERYVGDGESVWRPAPPPPGPAATPSVPPGAVVECCEPALALLAWLGARLAAQGGAALLFDYGPAEAGYGDSLQALRARAPCDPFAAAPGSADLTAHVDFPALAAMARRAGCAVYGPLPQGRLLAALGLSARTERLAAACPGDADRRSRLTQAAHRLADPARMGTLFKAMALCHPLLPAPPGFEAWQGRPSGAPALGPSREDPW